MSEKSGEKVPGYAGYTERQSISLFNKTGLEQGGTFPRGWKVFLPYLPIEMFDIQGVRKTPIYLMKMMEQTLWCAKSWADTPDEYTTEFSLRFKMEINAPFYHIKRFKYPLEVEQRIEYVRRTSKLCTSQLRERDISRPLVSGAFLTINVDPETRQAKSYPEKWKRKYSIPSEGPSLVIDTPMKPSCNVLKDQRVVRFTDVDRNNHTHYVVYIRMCLDAFYENILHEKYPNGPKVFLNGWLKCMTMAFKRDSVFGDILTIESWEDAQYKNTYHFEIYNGSTVVVALTLEFYASLTESSRL